MKTVILVSGPVGVGKSSFFSAFQANFGGERLSTRKLILQLTGVKNERSALQEAGEQLDLTTKGKWVADEAIKKASSMREDEFLLIDAIRIKDQIKCLRQEFGEKVFHLHLTASCTTLSERYAKRSPELKEFDSYEEVKRSKTEQEIEKLGPLADFILDTDRNDPETISSRVAYRLGWYQSKIEQLVDVLVGAQFGSEGKGNICAFLANEYEVLMRVGGPNAGHMVAQPPYKYIQLPSGTGSNPTAQILVGAGATIWVPQLLKEIYDLNLKPDRLAVDPSAMIITQSDRDLETSLETIGSTKQGVGVATARKILSRDQLAHLGSRVQLARDIKELAPFIRDTKFELERAYKQGKRVMLEGTQGTDLSLHHGRYPHVTSRETTASGCLADAGIGPRRVRKVIMVTRTYPIRVGGTSGDLPLETTLEVVSKDSRVPLDEITKTERGTVSQKERRIGEFNMEQVQRSAELNSATEIALTFVDYLGVENQKAKRFEDLTERAKNLIDEIEKVVGVPVALISKAFNAKAIIDLRGRRKTSKANG